MRWTIIAVILGIFLSPVSKAQTVIYSWRDEAGKIHIVDNMNKVPAEHRDALRIHQFSSMRKEEKPQPRVPSKPVIRAKGEEEIERREQFAEEMEEIRTSITLLSDRLDELTRERERGRLGIIRQRARGGSVVREQRKMEEIEGEIELLTTQLEKKRETLRSLENKPLKGGE